MQPGVSVTVGVSEEATIAEATPFCPSRFTVTRSTLCDQTDAQSNHDSAAVDATQPRQTEPPETTLETSTQTVVARNSDSVGERASVSAVSAANAHTICPSQLYNKQAAFCGLLGRNSSATITYGHSNGQRLVIRRILQWEEPNMHVVRKYSSACSSVSSSDESNSVCSPIADDVRQIRRSRRRFVVVCLSFSLGLTTLWRFPYLCHKFGAAAFCVAFCLAMLLCGVPLLLLHCVIGQSTRRTVVDAFSHLCPLLKGVGGCSVLVAAVLSLHQATLLSYTLFYLLGAFSGRLPWSHCETTWSRPTCHVHSAPRANLTAPHNATHPSLEYFHDRVLRLSAGIDHVTSFSWQLVLCLCVVCLLTGCILRKPATYSGKFVYVKLAAPYVVLSMILCGQAAVPGASEGLRLILQPRWLQLANPQLWLSAVSHSACCTGVVLGVVMLASSQHRPDCGAMLIDSVTVAGLTVLASVLVTLVYLATLGSMARQLHVFNIEAVSVSDIAVMFIMVPAAVSNMPLPQVWAAILFLLMLIIFLESQRVTLEVILSVIQYIRHEISKSRRRWWFHSVSRSWRVLALCSLLFVLALPFVSQAGLYILLLSDAYMVGVAATLVALCQLVVACGVYGVDALNMRHHRITGATLSQCVRLCWRAITPAVITLSLGFGIYGICDNFDLQLGEYQFPYWSAVLGWLLVLAVLSPIPVLAITTVYNSNISDNLLENIRQSLKPLQSSDAEPSCYEPTVGDVSDDVIKAPQPACLAGRQGATQ